MREYKNRATEVIEDNAFLQSTNTPVNLLK